VTCALHTHHPELRNPWGNISKAIPTVKPLEAEQPVELKVALLPFQRESLYWMREQEKGIWNGGILAVR
jgi:DNA repair protein RAD16